MGHPAYHPYMAGENHGSAILNEDDIRCIRAEPYYRGVNMMLSKVFAVHFSHISRIRRLREWDSILEYPAHKVRA